MTCSSYLFHSRCWLSFIKTFMAYGTFFSEELLPPIVFICLAGSGRGDAFCNYIPHTRHSYGSHPNDIPEIFKKYSCSLKFHGGQLWSPISVSFCEILLSKCTSSFLLLYCFKLQLAPEASSHQRSLQIQSNLIRFIFIFLTKLHFIIYKAETQTIHLCTEFRNKENVNQFTATPN